LIATIKSYYPILEDWTGNQLKWDYIHRTANLSMPGYITAALRKYQHPMPQRKQHAPHQWERPIYGAKQQLTKLDDTSPALALAKLALIQQIISTLLYYARAVDPTMLVAIGSIAANQSRGTKTTMQNNMHLLNYCATYPNAILHYSASSMILRMHSDGSYLSESCTRSRTGGHFFLGSNNHYNSKESNGAILTISQIIKNVMASAVKAECGALVINTKEAIVLCNTLEEMGHP
jgi:hypothetical protein